MPIPIISGPYKTFRDIKRGESFVEYEGSTITIPITTQRSDDRGEVIWRETDRIQLSAFMRLEVFSPYVNGLGTREFQFVIRDWELFGFSRLLNKLFYDDPDGRPRNPTKDNSRGRQIVAMTFTLSHNYVKYGDDDNSQFDHVDLLRIENITSHDIYSGNVFWQIEKGQGGGVRVSFHNKPPEGNQVATIRPDNKEDRERLLGITDERQPGESFEATLNEDLIQEANRAFAPGNTIVSNLVKLRKPVKIHWKLGRNPKPGARGRIRIVTPARSICTAHQGTDTGRPIDSADFPARIMYAASYHVFLNDTRFIEDQAGVAIADGVDQIPPRDVTVAFDKPHAGTVLGRWLEFGPGHCTGMHEITEEEFTRGKQYAEFWRTQPLA